MTRFHDTDQLIRSLALTPQAQTRAPWRDLRRLLPVTLATSLTLAVGLCFVMAGGAHGFAGVVGRPWFYYKLICMGALATGGWRLLLDVAQPGYGRLRLVVLAPAVIVLTLGAAIDSSDLPLAGQHPMSVPACLGAIVLLAAPAMGLILLSLRRAAATTRPALAGAVAGLVAGALGGAAYAFACKNDGGLFVAVWYGAAVGVTAMIGALVGRRALAW